LKVIALDINARHLRVARERSSMNALRSFRPTRSRFRCATRAWTSWFDAVFASLSRAAIELLLREFTRVARVGWTMHDTTRARLPLVFFRLTRPFSRARSSRRHDAEVSIRRAYTPGEMKRIVAPIAGAQVESHFPYR
jgi:hypothetical protein